nr:acyl-CoA dehydrogenase [Christensenella timonensis]
MEFTKENDLVRQMVRKFAENEVATVAAEIDKTEQFPLDTVKKMAKYGLMGMSFPSEYGGNDSDFVSYIIVMEELAKACGTTSVIVAAHTSLCASPIFNFGTEEQKRKYLPGLLSGEKLGAFGLTEPNAGSDAGSQQTMAVLEGDHYILNGSKVFITNAGFADVYIIFAMTDKAKGTRGISAFIVEKNFPGFSIGKIEEKLGIRASSTGELVMADCKVPKENLLGKENKGFGVAMATLDSGRIGIAAQALGFAEAAYAQCLEHVKQRRQFGKPLSKFQGLQWYLADMNVQVEAAKLLVYKAAFKKQQGLPISLDAAQAKLFAAQTANAVATKAIQVLGGYGYTMDYPVERIMRDAKITEIYEGTSEVQKMVIAANILK